jgi:hypothetical protein
MNNFIVAPSFVLDIDRCKNKTLVILIQRYKEQKFKQFHIYMIMLRSKGLLDIALTNVQIQIHD